jgi:cytochrome oxidase Cu insertion factor (SCO1/SenC/PrrC family)
MKEPNTPRLAVLSGALLAAALVLASCSSSSSDPPGPPPASSGVVQNRPIPASVSQIPLTNQLGQTMTLASLQGKTVMVVPFLTLCSDICPMTTGNLGQVELALHQAGAASKVTIVEVSVDPGRDNVARLAAYAKITSATWYLTTEAPGDLAALAKYFGFYYQQTPQGDPPANDWLTGLPLTYDIDHSDGYVLINPAGHEVFANDASPDFHGTLPAKLKHFLSDQGISHLQHPAQPSWTPSDALTALGWVVKKPLPALTS